jgi:S-DNA-T family DNA segregation ATPase FtsK/SpoIIIE
MIFVKWFGWSVLWLLPLLLRTVARALGRKSIFGGRGAIRLWCGSLLLLTASSAVESLVRSQLVTGEEGSGSALFGAALMDAVGGKISRGIAAILMLGLLALGLKWLLGAMFGRGAPAGRDEHPELDLGPPRRGSAESERLRMNSLHGSAGPARSSFPAATERRSSMPRAPSPGSAAAKRMPPASPFAPRPRPARLTPAPAPERPADNAPRDDWKVPLSALTGGSRNSQAAPAGSTQGGKWPAINPRQTDPAAKPRPESEWAAFESLRPTEAMLARAAASRAISAASAAADASLSRAATPSPPIRPIPPSIARGNPAPAQPTRSIRISSVGRTPEPGSAPGKPAERADVVPTRLMRSLQQADGEQETPPAAPLPPQVQPIVPLNSQGQPLPQSLGPVPAPIPLPPAAVAPVVPPFTAPMAPMAAPEPATPLPEPQPEPIDLGTFNAPWFDMLPDPAPEAPPLQPPAAFTVRMPDAVPGYVQPAAVAPEGYVDEPRVDIPLPSLDLLDEVPESRIEVDPEQLQETGRLIEQRLREFKVPVTVLGAEAGPVITRFEVEPAQGVRGAQVVNLVKDLSRALGLTSIRVVETIPGKTCMGLELPNARRQMIKLSEIVHSQAYRKSASHLTIVWARTSPARPW